MMPRDHVTQNIHTVIYSKNFIKIYKANCSWQKSFVAVSEKFVSIANKY